MPTLSDERLRALIAPYLLSADTSEQIPESLVPKLSIYLDLLLKWNAKTNLTAIRAPEQMVQRHFGESLFAGLCLKQLGIRSGDVLDLGSGAGFPGLPIQLLLPDLTVVLAESQGKKAAFLREAVRQLDLRCEVWDGRVEDMPPTRTFEVVTLRAVDQMQAMVRVGRSRVKPGGKLLLMTADPGEEGINFPVPERKGSFVVVS